MWARRISEIGLRRMRGMYRYIIPNWQGFHKIQIKKMLVVANWGLVFINFFV